jgi:hypothetical protein
LDSDEFKAEERIEEIEFRTLKLKNKNFIINK